MRDPNSETDGIDWGETIRDGMALGVYIAIVRIVVGLAIIFLLGWLFA